MGSSSNTDMIKKYTKTLDNIDIEDINDVMREELFKYVDKYNILKYFTDFYGTDNSITYYRLEGAMREYIYYLKSIKKNINITNIKRNKTWFKTKFDEVSNPDNPDNKIFCDVTIPDKERISKHKKLETLAVDLAADYFNRYGITTILNERYKNNIQDLMIAFISHYYIDLLDYVAKRRNDLPEDVNPDDVDLTSIKFTLSDIEIYIKDYKEYVKSHETFNLNADDIIDKYVQLDLSPDLTNKAHFINSLGADVIAKLDIVFGKSKLNNAISKRYKNSTYAKLKRVCIKMRYLDYIAEKENTEKITMEMIDNYTAWFDKELLEHNNFRVAKHHEYNTTKVLQGKKKKSDMDFCIYVMLEYFNIFGIASFLDRRYNMDDSKITIAMYKIREDLTEYVISKTYDLNLENVQKMEFDEKLKYKLSLIDLEYYAKEYFNTRWNTIKYKF